VQKKKKIPCLSDAILGLPLRLCTREDRPASARRQLHPLHAHGLSHSRLRHTHTHTRTHKTMQQKKDKGGSMESGCLGGQGKDLDMGSKDRAQDMFLVLGRRARGPLPESDRA